MMPFRHLRATSLAAAAALTVGTLALATPAAHAQGTCTDDFNCYSCSSADGDCARCNRYTGLNAEKKCVRCADSNCKDCSADYTKCDTCLDGFGRSASGDACVACDKSNCALCTDDAASCTQCAVGYGLAADGACGACAVVGCGYCATPTAATCVRCKDGFGLNPADGTCFGCELDNCVQCNTDAHSCSLCASNFVWDAASSACVACPANCATCKVASTGTVCSRCAAGFRQGSDGACEACSDYYCAVCPDAADKCTSCFAGHYFSDGGACVSVSPTTTTTPDAATGPLAALSAVGAAAVAAAVLL